MTECCETYKPHWLSGSVYDGDPHRYLMVLPQLKMLICLISKSGCTSLTDMTCSINKNRPSYMPRTRIGAWEQGCTYNVAHPARFGMNKTAYSNWPGIVFVRDPLERLLSGYLSKCMGADPGGHETCRSVFGERRVPFAVALPWQLAMSVGSDSTPGRTFGVNPNVVEACKAKDGPYIEFTIAAQYLWFYHHYFESMGAMLRWSQRCVPVLV